VTDSIPELVVLCNHSQSPFQVKYHIREKVVFGPDIVHSTAPVDYVSGYHVYLSLNIGYIDECNSRLIIPDITQKFPPKSSNYFIT